MIKRWTRSVQIMGVKCMFLYFNNILMTSVERGALKMDMILRNASKA